MEVLNRPSTPLLRGDPEQKSGFKTGVVRRQVTYLALSALPCLKSSQTDFIDSRTLLYGVPK